MAVPIVMPKLGMVMSEGAVARWAKSPGDKVARGEVIAEIETEKINYDMEATDGGIFHPVVSEGTIVPVQGLLGYLLAEGEAPPETPPEPPAESRVPATSAPSGVAPAGPSRRARAVGQPVPSTPGARRLAEKLGVDVSAVTPSGPRGRVVEADVRAHAAQREAAEGPSVPPGLPTPARTVPVRGMRKAIADRMRTSLANTAQLTYMLEVDVTEAQRLRREVSQESGKTITVAHVLIKACAEALSRVPTLNSVLVESQILYVDEINIGVAVALNEGLIVPVLRNVETKDIFQISSETHELAIKAREGKLMPDEVAGGTFTVSVLGTVDGFTPILNPGQSAILGVGRAAEKPAVRGGEIVIRELMTVSLTADHQVVDGAVAASFLRRFMQIIERPAALFQSRDLAAD